MGATVHCAKCCSLHAPFNIQFLFKPAMHIRIKPIAQIYIYTYTTHTIPQYRISYQSDNYSYFRRQTQNLSFPLLFRCQSVIFTAKHSVLPSIFHTRISILVVLMYLNFYPRKHRAYVLIMQPSDKHFIQLHRTGLREMYIFFQLLKEVPTFTQFQNLLPYSQGHAISS